MRKFVLLTVAFALVLGAASSVDVILAPTVKGEKSKIIPVDEFEKMMDGDRATYPYLMYFNMGGDTASHYTWTACASKFADTFMVWYDPPAACSINYGRFYAHNYFDSLNTLYATTFIAELDQSIDYYSDFNDANWLTDPCVAPYAGNPIVSIYQETQWTLPGGNWSAFNMKEELTTPVDNGEEVFGVGYFKDNKADESPNPAFWVNFSGAPLPTHSILHGDTACAPYHGWYIWYSAAYGAPFCAFAHVTLYENPPPSFDAYENSLYDTYSTSSREVNMHITDFGLPPDSSGIDMGSVELKYVVNTTDTFTVAATYVRGDSTDAYFVADIPGQNAGDEIVYWAEAADIQGKTGTGVPGSYTIRQGDPGDFLYIRDDYAVFNGGDIADILPNYYDTLIDVWDTDAYGPPDASVFDFYTTGAGLNVIAIRSWGVGFFNNVDHGMASDSTDLNYPCSTYAKQFLDNGGGFWLSDQDQGAGLGICPDYGHGNATGWVRNYLGAQGMYDDDAQLGGICLTAYSAGNPILDDLFAGIGYQASGQIYIAPYVYFDPTMAWSYTGSYDSLMTGTVQNMFDVNGRVFSYAWENPNNNSKVWMDFWAWDYIADPADSTHLDTTAVDTFAFDVLDWLGVPRSGIGDGSIEPANVVKLYPVNPVTNNATIRFSLPEKMAVSLDVYDNTGRLVKNLARGTMNAGLKSVTWDMEDNFGGKVANGVYFYRLSTADKTLTDKMVVVR